MPFAPANRLLLSCLGAIALSACTQLAGAPVVAVPENSELIPLSGSAAIIAATQGLPGSVIAAGDGSIVAAGAGNVVAGGAGNIIAAGAGNVIAAGGTEGAHSFGEGGGGVMEDLTVAKLTDGNHDGDFISHGPGRIGLQLQLKAPATLKKVVLHFSAKLPMPSYHVLVLLDGQGATLSSHLVKHGRADLVARTVTVNLSGEHKPAALRIVGPEGASLGLTELAAHDEAGTNVALGAKVTHTTRTEL